MWAGSGKQQSKKVWKLRKRRLTCLIPPKIFSIGLNERGNTSPVHPKFFGGVVE